MGGFREFRKIRLIASTESPCFGINIPANIANDKIYKTVFFKVIPFGSNILLESGAKP
jgi:hypothetical protein